MFIQTNDRLVNLKNVSNINVLHERDRIIFNMNYNIEMPSNQWNDSKLISDYVYWDGVNKEDFLQNLVFLNENKYFQDNFIDQIDGMGYININEISSVKFSEKKNRVIFNLSHPVTFTDFNNNNKITSEFVYVNCKNIEQFNDYAEYLKKYLK